MKTVIIFLNYLMRTAVVPGTEICLRNDSLILFMSLNRIVLTIVDTLSSNSNVLTR